MTTPGVSRKNHIYRLPMACSIDDCYDIGIIAVQGATKAAAAAVINRLADDQWAFVSADLKNADSEQMIDELVRQLNFDHITFGSIWEISRDLEDRTLASSQGAMDYMLTNWHSLHPESASQGAASYVISSSLNCSGVTEKTERILISFNGYTINVFLEETGICWEVTDPDGCVETGIEEDGSVTSAAIGLFLAYCAVVPDADDLEVSTDKFQKE